MRRCMGWIYREKGAGVTPDRIRVKLGEEVTVFNDSVTGADEAAKFVSSKLGDNWKLEDMQFLGYRIFIEESDLAK